MTLVLCGTIFSCDTLCGAERQEKKSAIKFEVWNNLSTRVCAASFSFQRHADLVHSRRIRSIRVKVGLARRWNGGAIFQERPNMFIVQNDSFSFRENNRVQRAHPNRYTPKSVHSKMDRDPGPALAYAVSVAASRPRKASISGEHVICCPVVQFSSRTPPIRPISVPRRRRSRCSRVTEYSTRS